MKISEAMSKCINNRVRVYPIISNGLFKIQRDFNGIKYTYDKRLNSEDVNNAMKLTYIALAKKI